MPRNYVKGLDWARHTPPDEKAAREMDFATGRGSGFAGPPFTAPGPQLPPRESVAADAPFARIVFPPRIEKLPTSADFNVRNYAVALGAGVGTTAAGPGFTLPETMVGWLQQVFIYLLAPIPTTRVVFAVRINGGPVPGFDSLENPPGAANFLLLTTNDVRVRLPSRSRVDVVMTNGDGAAITCGALLAGWYHPLADELRMYGNEGA